MKVVIANNSGFRNKGCEAMTKVIVREITKLMHDAEFRVFTNDPVYDALWMHDHVSFLASPFGGRLDRMLERFAISEGWLYCRISKLLKKDAMRKALEAFNWADAVLSTGGDVFSSTYGTLTAHLLPIRLAIRKKKSVILVAHSIGPFKNEKEYNLFVKVMKKISLITVRESRSFKYVKNMSLGKTKVELTADPAFALPPAASQCIEQLWNIYKIPHDQPTIGIAPSQSIAFYGKLSYTHHFEVLLTLIKFLVNELNCHIVLIPHVQGSSTSSDDYVMCNQLYRHFNFSKDITVISLDHSAEEIRGMMSKLDLTIAERMHAAIASLSQNVPTFVVGYGVKTEGILGDIFGFNNLENHMISVKKLNEMILKERVKNLLGRRKEVARYLSKVIPSVKKNAKRNFTLIMDVLKPGEK